MRQTQLGKKKRKEREGYMGEKGGGGSGGECYPGTRVRAAHL